MRVGRVQEGIDAANPGGGQRLLQDDANVRRVELVLCVFERTARMEKRD